MTSISAVHVDAAFNQGQIKRAVVGVTDSGHVHDFVFTADGDCRLELLRLTNRSRGGTPIPLIVTTACSITPIGSTVEGYRRSRCGIRSREATGRH